MLFRWQEWDWNLTFSEFNQAVLRIADLKLSNSQVLTCRLFVLQLLTKVQEKAVQMRLDLFMKGQPFKDYLATKVLRGPLVADLAFDLSSNNCAQMLMIFYSSRKIRRRRCLHENLKTIPSVDRIIKCECDCK